jgi:uridine nucleosidase
MYRLNSRLDASFPRPPYAMWRMDPDDNAIGKSTLTGNIFLLNIAVFGLQTLYPRLTSLGAKRSDLILEGRQLHRLITPIFLHGGLGHLLANGYSLRSMGNNVERAFGRNRLMATYLASGVAGNVVSSMMSPNPAVGASGAIFGLVGAYYTFLARNRELFGRAGEIQKGALIETIGLNLLLGMTNPMIDNWGHIGGFVGGVGMAYLIGPKLYVARIPIGGGMGGVDSGMALFGAGGPGVLIDRPTFALRSPAFVDGGMSWMADNMRALGGRATANLIGMFNGGWGGRGDREYYYDGVVDYGDIGGDAWGSGGGGGTIYRVLRDDIKLDGSMNVDPSDGFRQDVSEIDPMRIRQSEGRKRRKAPREGRSIRPTYGHLYR